MTLSNVIFNPSKSVTYMPNGMKQLAEMTMENNEQTPIIFKWKSTRPSMYKMRPVYGLIKPGEKKVVKLIFKGLAGKTAPTKDHYSCVMAATTSTNVCAELVWKQHHGQSQIAESSTTKRNIRILYVGINDGPEETEDKDKAAVLQKKRSLMEDNDGSGRGPVVIALYVDGDDDNTDSDEDEEGRCKGETVSGVQPVTKMGHIETRTEGAVSTMTAGKDTQSASHTQKGSEFQTVKTAEVQFHNQSAMNK